MKSLRICLLEYLLFFDREGEIILIGLTFQDLQGKQSGNDQGEQHQENDNQNNPSSPERVR